MDYGELKWLIRISEDQGAGYQEIRVQERNFLKLIP